jgi:hypothetical protein
MPIIITPKILEKLADENHKVTQREIEQCFDNRYGCLLIDPREEHKTNPPTVWFVAPTNKHRMLKIVCVIDGHNIYIKSAYEATAVITAMYNKRCH